jgi:hypothetical protein
MNVPTGEPQASSSKPAIATAIRTADVPIWPSGAVRLVGGILEITGDHGVRVPARNIIRIGVVPPQAGRLSLTLRYRAGVRKHETSYWIDLRHEPALRELVTAIEAAQRDA